MDVVIFWIFTFIVLIILSLLLEPAQSIIGTAGFASLMYILQFPSNSFCDTVDQTSSFVGNGNSWTFRNNDDMLGYEKADAPNWPHISHTKTSPRVQVVEPIPRVLNENHVINYGDGTGFKSMILKPNVLKHNAELLHDVMYPKEHSVDDKILDVSRVSALKAKKSLDIRSHWNNNNWKRYYDYEMGIHEAENRDWWSEDDYELSKKHVVI